jgi:hypothetical protein
MRYQIELAHSEPIHTAVIRGRVRPQDLAQFVPAACGEVWSFVRSANLPRPGRHLALYLDEQGSVVVGVELSEPFVGNEAARSRSRRACSRRIWLSSFPRLPVAAPQLGGLADSCRNGSGTRPRFRLARFGHLHPGFEHEHGSGDFVAEADQSCGIGEIVFRLNVLEAVRHELDNAGGRVGQECGRDVADVAHRKFGVALGEGEELVQGRWLVRGHGQDSHGTAALEQAHLASVEPIVIGLETKLKLSTTHSLIPQWEEGWD